MSITITVTGNLLNIADGAETAQVTCTLIGYGQAVPRVSGTGIIVNPLQGLVPAATSFSFTIISPNHIVPNGVPNQLFHVFNFYNHRGQLTSTGTYDLSGIADGGSADISTLTPLNNTGVPATGQAVLLNPSGTQSIAGFGLDAPYFGSLSANLAQSGAFRMANGDLLAWRNHANTGDDVLGVNSSDQLTYNGVPVGSGGGGGVIAQTNLTAQGANVAATTLYAVPVSGAGIYRIHIYIVVSRAGTTSTLPDSRLIYTDQDSGATITVPVTAGNSGNTTSTFVTATIDINAKASTNVQYDIGQITAYASTGGTSMQFAYRNRMEYLG